MKQKLFLGIILIITIISSMLITITEGACNYNDGGGISGNQEGTLATKGAPVTNRTEDACNKGMIIENESQLKQAETKLNELKKIVANVQKGVYGNTKNIKKNKLASSQMKGAVMPDSDMDTSDEEAEEEQDAKICDKYPEGC